MTALSWQRGITSSFSPSWKADNPSVTDTCRKPVLEWIFLLKKKTYKNRSVLMISGTPICVGGTRLQLHCSVSVRHEKLCTFRTHADWQDLVNWIFHSFSSLKKYSIISLVTYSPMFLTYLIIVFKVIGFNCSFTLIDPSSIHFFLRNWQASLLYIKGTQEL